LSTREVPTFRAADAPRFCVNRSDPLRPLLYALRSPSPADRHAAALALNRRSTERLPKAERRRLTPGLLDALRDADARVRRLAEIGLEHAHFSGADRRALARPPRSAEACRLLGRWLDVLPSLRRALLDPSPRVRGAARQAVAEAEGAWSPCDPRHETPIEAIDISPDGLLLASGCQDGVLVIWDLPSGRSLFSLRRPGDDRGGVRSLAFHPSGSRLAVGHSDGLTVLDPGTGQVLRKRDAWKKEMVFGGRFMDRGSGDMSRIQFLDAQGRSRRTLKLKEEVYSASISRDLSTLVVRRHEHLSVIDGGNAKTRRVLPTLRSWKDIALSPDGGLLAASAGSGTEVCLWDTRTGEPLAEWRTRVPWGAAALEFSSDGRRLACGAGVLDLGTRDWLWRHASTTWVRTARFTLDGAFLATAGDDQVVTLWDAATGRKERTFGVPRNEVGAIRVSGATVAVGYEDGRVDVRRGKRVETFQAGFRVRSLSFSPDRRRLACAGEDSHAKLFDPDGVRELRPWDGRVASVAWSPTGDRIALGGRSQETAQVVLYDSVGACFSSPFRQPRGKPFRNASDLAFSPDGKVLAGILDGTPVIWKEEDWQPRPLPELDWTCGLAFSPDGRLLVGGTTGYQIAVWDVENLQLKDVLYARRDSPSEFAFSPDGLRLAFTTSYDSAVEVRDVATGARLAILRGHAGSGRAVAWGRRLVTGASDGRLIFWPRV
jgi:WD40 repeat protein